MTNAAISLARGVDGCKPDFPDHQVRSRSLEMDAIFAAVDFKTVAAAVGVIGIAVIGIHMAFKGIDLGKRGVKKA